MNQTEQDFLNWLYSSRFAGANELTQEWLAEAWIASRRRGDWADGYNQATDELSPVNCEDCAEEFQKGVDFGLTVARAKILECESLEVLYRELAKGVTASDDSARYVPAPDLINAIYSEHNGHHVDFAADILERFGGWPEGILGHGGSLMRANITSKVVDIIQRQWDDWCDDTGCIPDDFEIHGPGSTQVSFRASTWAYRIANKVEMEVVEFLAKEARRVRNNA